MNRRQKEQSVAEVRSSFQDRTVTFVVEMKGMSVAQVQSLRRSLRAQQAEFKVTKNRLVRRAAADIPGVSELIPYLKNQVGIVCSSGDVAATAGALHAFKRECPALVVVAGRMGQEYLSSESVALIATLPSRQVLLAQVAGALSQVMGGLVRVLHQVAEKNKAGE